MSGSEQAAEEEFDTANGEHPDDYSVQGITHGKRQRFSESEIVLRFTSCGRCSLFLAAYRLHHNEEFLKAIEEIEARWLTLPWHPDMRDLVLKSYGRPIDIASYFFEGTCPECRRSFSYAELDPEQPALFLIQI